MTSVCIASKNPSKVFAAKQAFHMFLASEVEMYCENAKSNVPEQPIDKDVYLGAKNRLENLKKSCTRKYDYYVSCEGGLIEVFEQYFNFQVVIVEDKYGKQNLGISQGYPIPKKYLADIKATSLAEVLDKIFNGKGGVRILTNGIRTRENLICEATIMALTGINEVWSD